MGEWCGLMWVRPVGGGAAAVLRVLGAGDRFGHGGNERWEHLWAGIDPRPQEGTR